MDGSAGGCSAPSTLSADGSASSGENTFRHCGAVARSAEHLAALALPFVEEGLRAGDLVALACAPSTADRIAAALGERASVLASDSRLVLGDTRAPESFAAIRALVRRAADARSGRLRILAEVQPAASARDRREGERYEAAANVLLASSPITGMCLYAGWQLAPDDDAGMRATHPLLADDGAPRPNPAYRDPRHHVLSLPVPREPVESAPPALVIDDATSLPQLRHALAAVVDTWVRDPEQREDLRLGLAEVAANAFRHGRRPVSARVWVDRTRMVCTVTDRGHRPVDPLAGFVPAHGDDLSRGGMGLWLARKLFDSVDLISRSAGFTVRLATDLR